MWKLLAIAFCLHLSGRLNAQASLSGGIGLNQSYVSPLYLNGHDAQNTVSESYFLLDFAYSEFNKAHYGVNYGLQFLHKDISGFRYSGGNGGGTRFSGYGNVSYLYLSFLPTGSWGNRVKFQFSGGVQLGFRLHAYSKVYRSSWDVLGNRSSSLQEGRKNTVFLFLNARIPLSSAVIFQVSEKWTVGLKGQMAIDPIGCGSYFASYRGFDTSLLLTCHYSIPSLGIGKFIKEHRYPKGQDHF